MALQINDFLVPSKKEKSNSLTLFPGVPWAHDKMYLLRVCDIEYSATGTVLRISVSPQRCLAYDPVQVYKCKYYLGDGHGEKYLYKQRGTSRKHDVHAGWFWKHISHALRFIPGTGIPDFGREDVGQYQILSQAAPIKKLKNINTETLVVEWCTDMVKLEVPQESYNAPKFWQPPVITSLSGEVNEFTDLTKKMTDESVEACYEPRSFQFIAALSQLPCGICAPVASVPE